MAQHEAGIGTLLRLGLTAILVGYFLVWLPQPAAGLSFIGLEMGEWVKFIPEVAAGQIAPGRNLYYLPPPTVALVMIVVSAGWPNRRWQTMAFRLLAVLVAALALPSLEAILDEPASEWLLRLALVSGVALAAGLVPLWARYLPRSHPAVTVVLVVLGLAGALLPLWAYLAMRPAFERLFGQPVGLGPGLWLNTAGHLAVIAAAYLAWSGRMASGPAAVRIP